MRLVRSATLAVLVVALAGPAGAASPEKVKALFKLMKVEQSMAAAGPMLIKAFVDGYKATASRIPDEALTIISEEVNATLEQAAPEILEQVSKLYEATFTDEDLDSAMAFYSTESGQRLLAKLPELQQKGAQIGQAAMMARIPELQSRMKARLDAMKPGQPTAK